jgi:hypothetical protein
VATRVIETDGSLAATATAVDVALDAALAARPGGRA